eukprot:m.99738 g.99738  ORF g.99738 m.99738 type:complete len:64 (-) comp27183_c0_seq2:124-315(-)
MTTTTTTINNNFKLLTKRKSPSRRFEGESVCGFLFGFNTFKDVIHEQNQNHQTPEFISKLIVG